MVLLVVGMFGASFLCSCLCRRVAVRVVCGPSNILCIADPLCGRLGTCGRPPSTSGDCRDFCLQTHLRISGRSYGNRRAQFWRSRCRLVMCFRVFGLPNVP